MSDWPQWISQKLNNFNPNNRKPGRKPRLFFDSEAINSLILWENFKMGRYLAIDYGSKRCGIAVSDPMKIIATGLDTVPSHELILFLEKYFTKEEVDCVVIGKPVRMNMEHDDILLLVERFASAFRKRFPSIRVEWEDERFSSKIAMQAMIDGGMKKKERMRRENVDKISAAVILQSFMERENNQL